MDDKAPIAPMEALLVERLPEEEIWQFEPKRDGFRYLSIRRAIALEKSLMTVSRGR